MEDDLVTCFESNLGDPGTHCPGPDDADDLPELFHEVMLGGGVPACPNLGASEAAYAPQD